MLFAAAAGLPTIATSFGHAWILMLFTWHERRRYFALVELSDEDYQNELHWHRQFEEYVSQGLTEEQQSEWEKNYSVYQKQRESTYGNKEVTAWF